MFDLGWSELMLVGTIAVLILGPKELPRAMRTMAKWVRKARLLASDFQRHIDDVVRESELDDLRKEANKLARQDIGRKIDETVDPDGSVARSLHFDDRVDPTGPTASASTPSGATVKAPAASGDAASPPSGPAVDQTPSPSSDQAPDKREGGA